MPPAAPQTVRSVETASALYVGSPTAPPSATQYRDAADGAASSDDEAFDDDGWVPVPQDLVHTWRTVAITGAALRGSSSLDLATAAAAAAPTLAAKMSAMRVVASCNNLQSLLAPPPVPAPKPPLLVIPAPPSVASSGASSVRLSVDLSVSDAGGSLDLAQREPRDSVNAAAEAASPRPATLAVAQQQRGRTGSPLPWLAPLAKKLRRNTSFGRLVGKS